MTKIYHPEELTLSNGLPVILQHYEGQVATIYWWVRVGSGDESPSQAGFAHFLEHMLFKDAAAKETGRASAGQTARAIESLGGDINAYTSFDQTVYHVTCAENHWEKVLDVFGKMAKPQRFLKQDFVQEREVILEELKKNEDSPHRQLFQALFMSTFSRHPYGRPVIGFVKTLRAAKVAQLEAFYRKHYSSGNMGLVLVGPFEGLKSTRKKKLLKILETRFGKKVLKKTEIKKIARPVESPLRPKACWDIKTFDLKSPTFSIAFRVPEMAHEDLPALDLLSNILGSGELSRLYQQLFYKSSLVVNISGGLYVSKDPGMLYFQAELDSVAKIKPALEEIFNELKRMIEEGPRPEELSRALANAESERFYATQTVDGVAGKLGFLAYLMGNLQFDSEYLDELKTVDSFRIREVAKKYLDFRRMSGAILVPASETLPDAAELEKLAETHLNFLFLAERQSERLFPYPFKKIAPKSRTQSDSSKNREVSAPDELIQLPSGLKVSFYARPHSRVFSLHASALGGARLELTHPIERAETDWGSSYMMALTWTKATSAKDAKEIATIVEGSAAHLEGFSGRNTIGLQMTGLSRDWGALSQLFSEVLIDPLFPKTEVDHSRRVAEDSVRSVEDHSSQLCSKLFLETLFEHHPYGRMPHGSLESLHAIHSAKLRAFHRGWIRPERLVLSMSGPVKRNALEAWLNELDRNLQKMAQGVTPFDWPLNLASEKELPAPRWVERSLGREQCHILVGGLGSTLLAEDRFPIRLMQTLLGGQSGRLFIELREKKSLAYTVSPVTFEGIERGYIGTYIACSPQKREEALSGIRQVLETLAKSGPSELEMRRAKEFFMGKRAMDLQSDSSLAAHYGLETLYGIPRLSFSQLSKKMDSITARDIQKVCKKYLLDSHMVTSVVG